VLGKVSEATEAISRKITGSLSVCLSVCLKEKEWSMSSNKGENRVDVTPLLSHVRGCEVVAAKSRRVPHYELPACRMKEYPLDSVSKKNI
jgi:hypothetical protein